MPTCSTQNDALNYYYFPLTFGCSGMQAPTSVTVICTRRGLEKSMEGVCSCVGRWIFSMSASVAAWTYREGEVRK